jgi:hypothetical protein
MRRIFVAAALTLFGLSIAGASPGPRSQDSTGARVAAERGEIRTVGVQFPAGGPSLRFMGGPRTGVAGFSSTAAARLDGALDAGVGRTGSLQFWFHTAENFRSTQANRYAVHPLVEIPGVLTTCFVVEASSINFLAGCGARRDTATEGAGGVRRDVTFERRIRVLLPEWPGPAWHHVAIHWNSETGEANVYLDGTPYHFAGSRIEPWKARHSDRLALHLDPRFPLADVRVDARPFDPAALPEAVGAAHWQAKDELLGVRGRGRLKEAISRGRLLYARPLAAEADVADWVMEGPGERRFRDGWMELRSARPDGPNGHVVFWPPERLPARVVVEFDFDMVSETGLNILFFAAKPRAPGLAGGIFAPGVARRDGTFIGYTHGDIDSYHISYFANAPAEPRAVSNLRKNSGFYLLANGPVSLARGGEGRKCHAVLLLDGSRIVMAVDGVILIDFTDDGTRAGPPLAGGHIGFRQMQWGVCRYRNLQVHELVGEMKDYLR